MSSVVGGKPKFELPQSSREPLASLHSTVYFDENDFEDDDKFDFSAPILPPSTNEQPLKASVAVSDNKAKARRVSEDAHVAREAAPPSSVPLPWSSSPPAHFQPPKKRTLPWLEKEPAAPRIEEKNVKTPVAKPTSYAWDKTLSAVKEEQKELRKQQKLRAAIEKQALGLPKPTSRVASIFLSEEQKKLRQKYKKEPDRVAVTASTGLAACNIEGVTLHSFAGVGLGKEDATGLVKRNQKARNRWLRTKVLVIDEISMVDGEFFDKLEEVARKIRNNGRPFGGIQLVVTGDFFQLPPVPDSNREARFAFGANTWNTQKDPEFASMLNELRLGQVSQSTIDTFRQLSRPLNFEDDVEATELFPTRQEVDQANSARMNRLSGDTIPFHAVDSGTIQDVQMRDRLLSNCMAPPVIHLKKGAQVMLIKNMDESLVNGSLGKIVAFMDDMTYDHYTRHEESYHDADHGHEDDEPSRARKKIKSMAYDPKNLGTTTARLWPLVSFVLPDGTERQLLCRPETWKIELPNGEVQAQRAQVPLILAWALSIHKAQGQTLQRVKVDLGRVFEKGQAYVALSRATSTAGLQVTRFESKKVMVHTKVKEFYGNLSTANDASASKSKSKKLTATKSDAGIPGLDNHIYYVWIKYIIPCTASVFCVISLFELKHFPVIQLIQFASGYDKELPLAGMILCCTSILPEQRVRSSRQFEIFALRVLILCLRSKSHLAAIAAQMGATHNYDLTSDVTHLIVGDTNTSKYKYVAQQRSDVKVVTAEWVEAVRASWLLGGDTDIRALEEEHRLPTFVGLTICITGFDDPSHISLRLPGDSQKYKYAMMWNIKVVSLRWLEDSLERGMILDESLYDPLLPLEQQGIGAWNRAAPIQVEKRPKASEITFQRPRKLRRVASVKLGDQNEGIWTDIMGSNSAGLSENELLDDLADATPKPRLQTSIQATRSFASETTFGEPRDSITHGMSVAQAQTVEIPRGIWYKTKFFISGFTTKQNQILKNHILARDGEVAASIEHLLANDAEVDSKQYILVPYSLPQSDIPSTADSEDEVEIVTDMWIEKCLHTFQELSICSTGFTGIDLLHLSKLVTLLGAKYDEYLTPKASVLICNSASPNAEKLRHVRQWNIPAVLADWLWISVQTGDIKPFEPYVIPSRRSSSIDIGTSGGEHRGSKLGRQMEPESSEKVSQQLLKSQAGYGGGPDEDHSPLEAGPETNSRASPTKSPSHSPDLAPPKTDSKEDKPTTSSNSLDFAISELLRQKRSRSKQPSLSDQAAGSNAPPQRRKRLFGRAISNSSLSGPMGMSRASSIDTVNEDGYGSVVDSLNSPSAKGLSKAPSFVSFPPRVAAAKGNANPTEAQQLLENRLHLFRNGLARHESERTEMEDEETPPMTQLGYEDPDAVAMREKVIQRAREKNATEGDIRDENQKGERKSRGGTLVIGQLQDSEQFAGWGSGRRTRSRKAPNIEEDI
ncbi:DNA repair and recombination protein pif1 [Uncinocarpus reesii 1704]|uniref:ATP-dependent DNA helicase PIF1 n=1 Tax=Uncinocarpus reesii (strain UAMH 1704) TaxID=336963 RepID=C4JUZ0_UNCRE|nr:DNA repair and recombination protein pif1 [Uncinocarpus reesii 1704]EEP80101.1 DNA repair and recombination protein pif1 [Uncinocarpus reesii 1704]